MLWLRIIISILVLMSALVPIALQYHWGEPVTVGQKVWIGVLVLVFVVIAVVSGIISYKDFKSSEATSKELSQINDSVLSLHEKLDPFVELATSKYPAIPTEDALRKLYGDIDSLQKKTENLENEARKAKRGVTNTFDFNGSRRFTSSGRIEVNSGPEVAIYQKLAELEQNQKWTEMINLAEDQIKKTSEWLTPYLFAGVG